MIILRTFSKKNKESKGGGRKLSEYDSHRGLGRSFLLGGPGGAAGAYLTKEEADKLAAEGKNDREIINRVADSGTKKGALIGAGLGAAAGAAGGRLLGNAIGLKGYGAQKAVTGAITGGAWGALGGRLGAKKNARVRLAKERADRLRDEYER